MWFRYNTFTYKENFKGSKTKSMALTAKGSTKEKGVSYFRTDSQT